MLDCCKPLEEIKLTGINVQQFACVARCNRLLVERTYADSDDDSMVEQFRSTLLRSVRSDNEVMAVSYDRGVLGQTGTGHFSTIGGYHHRADKLLILDVARFKYPPHWVDLKLFWKAMRSIDPDTSMKSYLREFLFVKKHV